MDRLGLEWTRLVTHARRLGFPGCIVAALLVAACAASPPAADAYPSALALYGRAKELPGFADYVNAFVRSQNAQHLDERSGCYAKNVGQRISLILMVDRNGRIVQSYSDSNTPKAKCFKAAYLGAQMPIPPFVPLPVQLAMQ
jgi:hypothetical protein